MTTLCLDFGNTLRKGVIFSGDELTDEFYFKENILDEISEVINKYNPGRSILSSVIDHEPAIEDLLKSRTAFHKLSFESKLPFSISVSKKETIGTDRIALMSASANLFPGLNSLIIGIGSCITYNFINQYTQFLGGSISPGMEMRFRSMHDYTSRLPFVASTYNYPFTGYDTVTNIQAGVIHGIIAELDGIILKYEERYGNFNVLLTGGHSAYFAGQLKKKIFADFNFLFKGLYALSEINCVSK